MTDSKELYEKAGSVVCIKQPDYDELDFITKLWADNETMKDIGGPVAFQDSRKKEWYEKMVKPTDGRNFYCLVYNLKDEPVGEVSFHRYDETTRTAEFNVKILSAHRGKGYAKEAILLMLEYYFVEFGGEVMLDGIAINNINGQKALLKLGFEHMSTSYDVLLVGMTREKFLQLYEKQGLY